MPEWIAIILVTAGIGALGWILAWLINSLKDFFRTEISDIKTGIAALMQAFNDFKERLTKVEATCLTWEDLEKELGPVKHKVEKLEKNQSVMATTCTIRHSKDK